MENKKTFGEYLESLRQTRGYTQKELAERLGYTPQAISKFEHNGTSVPLNALPFFCNELQVSISSILERNESKQAENVSYKAINEDAFKDNILFLRKTHGYSQQKVAESIGISKRSIINYEAGEAIPNTDVFEKLIDLYKIPPDKLLYETMRPKAVTSTSLRFRKFKIPLYSAITLFGLAGIAIGITVPLLNKNNAVNPTNSTLVASTNIYEGFTNLTSFQISNAAEDSPTDIIGEGDHEFYAEFNDEYDIELDGATLTWSYQNVTGMDDPIDIPHDPWGFSSDRSNGSHKDGKDNGDHAYFHVNTPSNKHGSFTLTATLSKPEKEISTSIEIECIDDNDDFFADVQELKDLHIRAFYLTIDGWSHAQIKPNKEYLVKEHILDDKWHEIDLTSYSLASSFNFFSLGRNQVDLKELESTLSFRDGLTYLNVPSSIDVHDFAIEKIYEIEGFSITSNPPLHIAINREKH